MVRAKAQRSVFLILKVAANRHELGLAVQCTANRAPPVEQGTIHLPAS
jgi:hypothetical protein